MPELSELADAATAIGAVVAVIALVASMFFSRRSMKMSAESLEYSKLAIEQAAAEAWNVSAAQLAISFREHVIKLYTVGLTVEQIKALINLEKADQHSDEPGGALESMEWGNGRIEDIVAQLPERPPSSDLSIF